MTGNGSHVVVRDSVIAGNAGNGIHTFTMSGMAPAFLLVERSTAVTSGGTDILADGPYATKLLSENTVPRNGVGISAVNGGQLISYGNSRADNNPRCRRRTGRHLQPDLGWPAPSVPRHRPGGAPAPSPGRRNRRP